MRGVYTASYRISALAAAKTVIYLTAAANQVVEILSAALTNESNPVNQQLVCCLQRVQALGTPAATAVTPAAHEAGDQAAASTVKADVTGGEPTYAANSEIGREGFSSLSGWFLDPLPEERVIVPGGGTIGLRLLSAPTSFNGVVRMTFREIG